MGNIKEFNSYLDIQDKDGNVERHYPFTKAENVIGLEGAGMTENEKKALKLLAVNSYIVDDVTGQTYKIGSSNGKFYFEESDISIKDLIDTIVEATSTTES